jgi:redox-sensitive bicupin YhaK (pirin superfamily)
MSGPVEVKDVEESEPRPTAGLETVVTESRLAAVGAMQVRRALPTRGRRTVGAWCFADHYGPADVSERFRPDIGPHPHMGLQTVTWLIEGEVVHRDSLGSEQPIRPGQLNLMTAGRGVAHAEEAPDGYRGPIHGIQLWVAQPSATREGAAAFEHHVELPTAELGGCVATVIVGGFAGVMSTARRDSDHFGTDLDLRPGRAVLPIDPQYEHALLVASGSLAVGEDVVVPGRLLYLPAGRDELAVDCTDPSRALLLGGVPFGEQLLMWWNFVARSREEIDAAYEDWASGSDRFGEVASGLARIETAGPPWRRDGR